MWLVSTLQACVPLEEQRDTDYETVSFGGWVLSDPSEEEPTVLTAGALEVTSPDGTAITSGEQPYSDSPGWWAFEVEPGIDLQLRWTAPDHTTTVWRGRAPTAPGQWLTGAMFTWLEATTTATFATFAEIPGFAPEPLSDGAVAHLWGQPTYADPAWEDRWRDATMTVTDQDGAKPVLQLAQAEDGGLVEAPGEPTVWFFAPNLTPGPVTLRVEAGDGTIVETHWDARGGDLLNAWFYALGEP